MRTRPTLTVKQFFTVLADLASEHGENVPYDMALATLAQDVNVTGGKIDLIDLVDVCESIVCSTAAPEAKRAAFEVTGDALSVADVWNDRSSLLELMLNDDLGD